MVWPRKQEEAVKVVGAQVRNEYAIKAEDMEVKLWTDRPGRSIARNGAVGIYNCRKIHAHILTVRAANITDNQSEYYILSCGDGLYNGVIKVSHMYDVC